MKLINNIRKVVHIEEKNLKTASKSILAVVVLVFPISFYLIAKIIFFSNPIVDRLLKFGVIIIVIPIIVFIALCVITKIEYK